MRALHLVAVLVVAGAGLGWAQSLAQGTGWTGDVTYYGSKKGAGHCSFQFASPSAFTLPWTSSLASGVAMNHPQARAVARGRSSSAGSPR